MTDNPAAQTLQTVSQEVADTTPCTHPPTRLYCWHVGDVVCIACCDCGAVLKGGAQ